MVVFLCVSVHVASHTEAICIHCSFAVLGLVQEFENFDTFCCALVFDHISVGCTPSGNCLHFVPSLGGNCLHFVPSLGSTQS